MSEQKIKKTYKACVVGYLIDSGILFAQQSNSYQETKDIISEDVMRIMDDYKTAVTLSTDEDNFGDTITVCKFVDGDSKREIYYKVCFEDL